jgi:hypothetical protein
LKPGSAIDTGIGANGAVWIVGTTPVSGGNAIYVWNGSGWSLVSGGAIRIAVDPSGNPWVVGANSTIWRRSGGNWYQVPGYATDIGIGGDGMVWIVGAQSGYGGYTIYWWSGIDWVLSPGMATAISVGRGGKPWVANSLKQVYRAF